MSPTFKRLLWVSLILAALVSLAIACGSSSSGSSRKSCTQATQCGEGGRAKWVCAADDHLCYSVDEYCSADSQCIGTCVNHVCTGGKPAADGDTDTETPDGDTAEAESEQDPDDQIVCKEECCSDKDCVTGYSYCELSVHKCQDLIPCDADKQCCQDHTCQADPKYGPDWTCIFYTCVDPTQPCPFECCKQADCAAGYTCVTADGPQQGKCRNDSISCTPNEQKCCEQDPGNPDCNALTDNRKAEAIVVCNAQGNGVSLSSCPKFKNCYPPIKAGDPITCETSGRCGADSDCVCPNACLFDEGDTTGEGVCGLKTGKKDDICYDKACGSTEPKTIAICDEQAGLKCCVDQQTNVGKCGSC